jgi:hypothetical protein
MSTVQTPTGESSSGFRLDVPLHNLLTQPGLRTTVLPAGKPERLPNPVFPQYIYVPFEAPVIRPDVTGNLASDIPDRLVSWGTFSLPWHFTVSPVVDVHSGLPYSNVDALQNYVGGANSQRFPTFFSLDLKVYREFRLDLPGVRNRKLRVGVYTLNLTNHSNWLEVYNNVTSPYFGHLVGMQHRMNGLVIDIVK